MRVLETNDGSETSLGHDLLKGRVMLKARLAITPAPGIP
jgi:hypothetical protein